MSIEFQRGLNDGRLGLVKRVPFFDKRAEDLAPVGSLNMYALDLIEYEDGYRQGNLERIANEMRQKENEDSLKRGL